MGDDEARARATLNEMQLRISEGPYTALGIAQTASPEQVRAAFLELTKQFHPARFGRMTPELQRLSNEVFLGIKAAHDQLMKQLGGARRTVANQSGAIPVVQSDPRSGGIRAPIARGSERASQPVISRTSTPQTSPLRPTVQPAPARPAAAQPVRPATPQPARTTPAMGSPIMRPGTPPAARPGTPPVTRPGIAATARPAAPPAPTSFNPDTVRHSGVPVFDERTAHRDAMIALNEQDWTKARQTLQQLAQHRPQSKNYGALLAYARGREAQKLGRVSEALLEYQRALELEPDLAMAKQALAELQRRR